LGEQQILILTGDAGMGHRSAAEAIATALKLRHGEACKVVIANPLNDERVPAALREGQSGYDQIIQELPRLYELGYEVTDAAVPASVLEAALTVLLFGVVRDLVRRYQPDVIVSTFPLLQAPVGAVRTLDALDIPLVTIVTDLTTNHRIWFHSSSDLCVVPTQQAHDLAVENGFPPQRVPIVGIPVDPALAGGHSDRSALRAELGWQPDQRALLAVGGKRVRNLPEALRGLNHAALPLQIAIVAGGDDELYRTLQDSEWHTTVHLYNFVEDMPSLMLASDCVLCKAGGLIVTESLACGLPLLLIDVLPGQETGNAEYVVKHAAGDLVEDPISVLETLYHLLDQDGALLAERAVNAKDLGRPQAAFQIADLVCAAQDSLRPPAYEPNSVRARLGELLDRHKVPWR
jgi:1,2-diacylglycerol 3-beta-galactosyltransferase